MSSFLQLCQRVASESGVVTDDGSPASVAGQTGRLAKIVSWTNKAWEAIQTSRNDWLWMEGEATSTAVIPGTRRYSAADFAITRFSRWLPSRDPAYPTWFLYPTDSGVNYEGPLQVIPWGQFYAERMRGAASAQTGRPREFTIAPDLDVVLFPTPDAACTISTRFRKSVQALADNEDIPECPADHHEVIVYRALMMLATHDEAMAQGKDWSVEYQWRFAKLVNEQTPEVRIGGRAWV